MREVLIYQDGELSILGSRDAIRQAFARGLIKDQQVWMDMVDDRNRTSRIYNEELAKEIFDRIVDRYVSALSEFNDFAQALG